MSITTRSIFDHTLEQLARFIENHPRLFVLTGAGCSTDSGIPDYRDADGNWKHRQPVMYRDFLDQAAIRQRYWARSLVGWRRFHEARPNRAHHALAGLEQAGFVRQLVTQNVDGLHQKAGSHRVIDLHGRLDTVECVECGQRIERASLQETLLAYNPHYRTLVAEAAPDGDALLERTDFSEFCVPGCHACGGLLKPAVVFFGESIPAHTVQQADAVLHEADALLVVGSSLMVYSGYRFCRRATELGKPIAAINLGRTRADDVFTLKVPLPCGETLTALMARMA